MTTQQTERPVAIVCGIGKSNNTPIFPNKMYIIGIKEPGNLNEQVLEIRQTDPPETHQIYRETSENQYGFRILQSVRRENLTITTTVNTITLEDLGSTFRSTYDREPLDRLEVTRSDSGVHTLRLGRLNFNIAFFPQ